MGYKGLQGEAATGNRKVREKLIYCSCLTCARFQVTANSCQPLGRKQLVRLSLTMWPSQFAQETSELQLVEALAVVPLVALLPCHHLLFWLSKFLRRTQHADRSLAQRAAQQPSSIILGTLHSHLEALSEVGTQEVLATARLLLNTSRGKQAHPVSGWCSNSTAPNGLRSRFVRGMAAQHQTGRRHGRCECLTPYQTSQPELTAVKYLSWSMMAPLGIPADRRLCQVRRQRIKRSPYCVAIPGSTACQHILCAHRGSRLRTLWVAGVTP